MTSCAEAAVRAAGNLKSQALFDLLVRIDNDAPELADALVRCIPHVEDVSALYPRIDKWLSPKSVWQGYAHDCIRALGPRASAYVPKLEKQLAKADPNTTSGRGAAIHANVTLFRVTGDPKYYEAILQGLGERRDETVRIVSRTPLIVMGDRVRPDMERLLEEGTALQRENAAEVLAELDRLASPPGLGPKVARPKVPKAVSRKAARKTRARRTP